MNLYINNIEVYTNVIFIQLFDFHTDESEGETEDIPADNSGEREKDSRAERHCEESQGELVMLGKKKLKELSVFIMCPQSAILESRTKLTYYVDYESCLTTIQFLL